MKTGTAITFTLRAGAISLLTLATFAVLADDPKAIRARCLKACDEEFQNCKDRQGTNGSLEVCDKQFTRCTAKCGR